MGNADRSLDEGQYVVGDHGYGEAEQRGSWSVKICT
jgi:hypothetical protein